MTTTDQVRDRVARTLRDARNVPGVGDPSPWEEAPPAARAAYLREAAVLLAAFPGLAMLERLEGWMRGEDGRAVVADWGEGRAGYEFRVALTGADAAAPEMGDAAGLDLIATTTAALDQIDQAETQERER